MLQTAAWTLGTVADVPTVSFTNTRACLSRDASVLGGVVLVGTATHPHPGDGSFLCLILGACHVPPTFPLPFTKLSADNL